MQVRGSLNFPSAYTVEVRTIPQGKGTEVVQLLKAVSQPIGEDDRYAWQCISRIFRQHLPHSLPPLTCIYCRVYCCFLPRALTPSVRPTPDLLVFAGSLAQPMSIIIFFSHSAKETHTVQT